MKEKVRVAYRMINLNENIVYPPCHVCHKEMQVYQISKSFYREQVKNKSNLAWFCKKQNKAFMFSCNNCLPEFKGF